MTLTLDPANACAHHNGSIRRASGFVQTRLSSVVLSLTRSRQAIMIQGKAGAAELLTHPPAPFAELRLCLV